MEKRRKGSIFVKRAAKHINDFIRILVKLKDGTEFYLMVDRNVTIEYVAKQIEAEVAARSIGTNIEAQKNSSLADVLSKEQGGIAKAIDIYQLYDAANLALSFSAKVSDVLQFDDVVLPMTSIEEDEEDEEESSFLKTDMGSAFILGEGEQVENAVVSTMDDRLNSVLHNLSSLQFFNQFCLQEYSIENVLFWIECEVFKSIHDEEKRKMFAKHVFLAYIQPESPLCLNVDEEVRNVLMASYDKEPTNDMFEDIQNFVYILIKKHAYSRFENSTYFKRFLEFKEQDRYTYTQGKVDWNLDVVQLKVGTNIMNNINELVQIMEHPDSNEAIAALEKYGEGQYPSITSALFRHRVLASIISHYFPESNQIGKGYFDADSRNNFRVRQMNISKQKKLRKFFGAQITEEQMMKQTFAGSMQDGAAPVFNDTISMTSPEDGEFDKKKKADKLTGFFGDQLPRHQMKAQHLVNTDAEGYQSSEIEDQSPVSQVALLETINDLPAEEKAMLTRRAKKLLMMLGETLDGKEINASLGPAPHTDSPISPDSVLAQSDCVSIDLSIAEDGDNKQAQKQRLDKLSHFLGHRIAEADIVITEPQVIARPLTVGEKKIYQKKAGKLEQLLGSNVPADSIVNYASAEKVDDWMEELDEARPLPKEIHSDDEVEEDASDIDRKNKLARLRKLRKMLGISIDVTVLTEKVLKDLEESIKSEIHDPEDRALLQEDLERLKVRVSQNTTSPLTRPLAQ